MNFHFVLFISLLVLALFEVLAFSFRSLLGTFFLQFYIFLCFLFVAEPFGYGWITSEDTKAWLPQIADMSTFKLLLENSSNNLWCFIFFQIFAIDHHRVYPTHNKKSSSLKMNLPTVIQPLGCTNLRAAQSETPTHHPITSSPFSREMVLGQFGVLFFPTSLDTLCTTVSYFWNMSTLVGLKLVILAQLVASEFLSKGLGCRFRNAQNQSLPAVSFFLPRCIWSY